MTMDIGIGERMFRLDGRVAFVSGAAGHLGRSLARALAEAGAHVVLNGRDVERLDDFRKQLLGNGLEATTAAFDVTDNSALTAYFSRHAQEIGRLDVLVNNAHEGPAGDMEQATPDRFQDAYRVAVTAVFAGLMAAQPALLMAVGATGHASVINIASMYGSVSPDPSVYGDTGFDNPPFYGAAKGGLLQLTRYAACHLAAKGIRVNAISPGSFPAPEVCRQAPAFIDKLATKTPLGRIGAPDELKGAVLFLASDASSYVTGINLPVDGGWTIW